MGSEVRCGYCGTRGTFTPDQARTHFTADCINPPTAAPRIQSTTIRTGDIQGATIDPAQISWGIPRKLEDRARKDARAWVEKIKDDAAIIGHPDRELAWWRRYYERTDISDEYRAQALAKIVELEAALPAHELAQQLGRQLFGDDLGPPPVPAAPSAVHRAAETTHVVLIALSTVFGVGALLGLVLAFGATGRVNLPLLVTWLVCGVVFAWSRRRIATRRAGVRQPSA